MFWQFIKVTHMIGWRLMLLAVISHTFRNSSSGESILQNDFLLFLFPIIFSAVFVFGFKSTIEIFPLFRLILFKSPFSKLKNRNKPYKQKYRFEDKRKPQKKSETLYSSSQKGYISGFEPMFLDKIEINYSNKYMNGIPGHGLGNSGFNEKNIELGKKGEMNLAKSLCIVDRTGRITNNGYSNDLLINNIHTFWSMHIPSADSTPSRINVNREEDVDAIFVFKKSLILIDAKHYTGGNVIYETNNDGKLQIIDIPTKKMIRKPRTMTKNMEIATERYKKVFPNHLISSYIVLVPTNSGIGQIKNVKWPGNIPLIHLKDLLPIIASERSGEADISTISKLQNLVKQN